MATARLMDLPLITKDEIIVDSELVEIVWVRVFWNGVFPPYFYKVTGYLMPTEAALEALSKRLQTGVSPFDSKAFEGMAEGIAGIRYRSAEVVSDHKSPFRSVRLDITR